MARLTLAEAAEKLSLSTRTLRRRIKEGRLYADLEEGKYYISPTEIDRLSTEDNVDPAKFVNKATRKATPTETITLDRKEYDALISRLATLETEKRLLEAPKPGLWKRLFLGK